MSGFNKAETNGYVKDLKEGDIFFRPEIYEWRSPEFVVKNVHYHKGVYHHGQQVITVYAEKRHFGDEADYEIDPNTYTLNNMYEKVKILENVKYENAWL